MTNKDFKYSIITGVSTEDLQINVQSFLSDDNLVEGYATRVEGGVTINLYHNVREYCQVVVRTRVDVSNRYEI